MDGTLAREPSPGTIKATELFPEPGSPGDPVLRARHRHGHPGHPHVTNAPRPGAAGGKGQLQGAGNLLSYSSKTKSSVTIHRSSLGHKTKPRALA